MIDCEECTRLRAELDRAYAQVNRKRGSDRIYRFYGAEAKYDRDIHLWIAKYKGEEIGRDRNVQRVREQVVKWRTVNDPTFFKNLPVRKNTLVYSYYKHTYQRKDNVWYIDDKPTKHTSQKSARMEIKEMLLGHPPIETQDRLKLVKTTTALKRSATIYVRHTKDGQYVICRLNGALRNTKSYRTKQWSVKKYGLVDATRLAEDYRDMIMAKLDEPEKPTLDFWG